MPELSGIVIGDPVERWVALGFEVCDAAVDVGGVRLQLGGPGVGITGWSLGSVDGLASVPIGGPAGGRPPEHPNGAVAVDHVVVVTPSFDRTGAALAAAGLELKRVVEMRGTRMGFRRIGPAILELVEAPDAERTAFWGLVIVVSDLDGLAARLGEHLGSVRAAVQPGRRIATVRPSAGLTTQLAFMDPAARPAGSTCSVKPVET